MCNARRSYWKSSRLKIASILFWNWRMLTAGKSSNPWNLPGNWIGYPEKIIKIKKNTRELIHRWARHSWWRTAWCLTIPFAIRSRQHRPCQIPNSIVCIFPQYKCFHYHPSQMNLQHFRPILHLNGNFFRRVQSQFDCNIDKDKVLDTLNMLNKLTHPLCLRLLSRNSQFCTSNFLWKMKTTLPPEPFDKKWC